MAALLQVLFKEGVSKIFLIVEGGHSRWIITIAIEDKGIIKSHTLLDKTQHISTRSFQHLCVLHQRREAFNDQT